MAIIHLIEGPVGSGKSTFAGQLCQRTAAVHFNFDSWMARLFSPDRPNTDTITWYMARKQHCIEQIWQLASAIVATNNDVVLELGLIQQQSREALYQRADEAGYKVIVYVLDAPRDIRRERVRHRNFAQGETYSMNVTDEIFEITSNMWEMPDDVECSEREVQFISIE